VRVSYDLEIDAAYAHFTGESLLPGRASITFDAPFAFKRWSSWTGRTARSQAWKYWKPTPYFMPTSLTLWVVARLEAGVPSSVRV
jgi:hypothetical protein